MMICLSRMTVLGGETKGKTNVIIPEHFRDYPTSDTLLRDDINPFDERLNKLLKKYSGAGQSGLGKQTLEMLSSIIIILRRDKKIRELPKEDVLHRIELPEGEAKRIRQDARKMCRVLKDSAFEVSAEEA